MTTKTIEPVDITNSGTAIIDTKDVSCRVTNSLLKCLETLGYSVDSLIEGLPFSREYLSNPLNWVPYSVRDELCERTAKATGDERIMYRVGLATPKLKSINSIEYMVRLLGSPSLAYKSVPKYSTLFDKNAQFETKIVNDCKAIVTMTVTDNYPFSRHVCYYTQGILAAIPTIWGLPPAEINETQCMCENNGNDADETTEDRTDRCVYEVTWQPLKPLSSGFWGRLFMRGNISPASIKELENNFKLLDKKNAELEQKNMQLSKVRELALAIDGLRTVDDVLRTVVELARDISGVRFVIVLRHNDDSEYEIARYHSKIRNKAIAAALKATGFDTNLVFGDDPNSQKFRYLRSASKLQKDYEAKPRTMNISSLAQLLDGIWPKVLCDTIQSITGIKMTTVVPIIIDNKSWGAILFFLDELISTEILEMMGAHCAAALKNVSRIEILEQHNRELEALNTITRTTTASLNLEIMLSDVIKKSVEIFRAKSGTIYLLDDQKQTLKMRANYGMAENMVKTLESISLDNSISGTFFASDKDLLWGDFRDYVAKYPAYTSQLPHGVTLPFAMAVLKINKVRTGLITIVRNISQHFQPHELQLLQAMANQISVAVENARLHGDVVVRMAEAEQANAKLQSALKNQAESERKYRLIAENTADYISILTFKGIYTYVSPSHQKLGFSEADLLGKSGFDLIHPEDKKRLLPLMTKYAGMRLKELLGLKGQNYSEIIDFRFRDSGGKWHDIEANASLIDSNDGEEPSILLVCRDVTEHKTSEAKLFAQKQLIDRILASTPNAVMVVDKEHKIILANSAFYHMINHHNGRVEGQKVEDIICLNQLTELISAVLKGKTIPKQSEFKCKLGNLEKYIIANIINMAKDEVLVILNDVTEAREIQAKLNLNERLISVGEIASGVAHELNNPLTSITMLSQMLIKDNMPKEDKEDLEIISNEAKRAAAIVKSLLTFARKHAPERKPAQINLVLEDVLKLRAYEHRVNNIEVNTRFDQHLPEVMIDYHQMQQVFLNLILNAEQAMIDFNHQGTLTVVTERVNGNIKISVMDDGPGISDENKEKIFTPFFTTKEVGKGTGLGLSICYGIVTNHGGKIYAESKQGKGTTFVVELPVNGHQGEFNAAESNRQENSPDNRG